MALGDPYVTLAEVKDYLKIPTDKTAFDAALTDAIESSSVEIERHCNRQFNKASVASPRLYEPFTYRRTYVDDFWTTSGLVVEIDTSGVGTFDQTWSAADYELHPLGGVVDGQDSWPYNRIESVQTWFPYPCRRKGIVRVTAQWGWNAVPAPVRQACLIMAAETFKLKDAPFGVAGSDQFGTILRVHDNRMAASKLQRYVRHEIQVG